VGVADWVGAGAVAGDVEPLPDGTGLGLWHVHQLHGRTGLARWVRFSPCDTVVSTSLGPAANTMAPSVRIVIGTVNTNGRQALARRLDWCLGRGISREGISSLVACPENGLIPGLGLAFRRPPKARGWSGATDKPDAAWLFAYDAHLARTWLAHRDDVRDCQGICSR